MEAIDKRSGFSSGKTSPFAPRSESAWKQALHGANASPRPIQCEAPLKLGNSPNDRVVCSHAVDGVVRLCHQNDGFFGVRKCYDYHLSGPFCSGHFVAKNHLADTIIWSPRLKRVFENAV
jgi:hypothetical protein